MKLRSIFFWVIGLGIFCLGTLGFCPALAIAQTPGDLADAYRARREAKRLWWSGYGLPYVTANSTDGTSLGAGTEIFARPREQNYGYLYKITASSLVSTNLNYQSHWVQFERRGAVYLTAGAGYRQWNNMLYAGAGGDDVSVQWGALESGNAFKTPYSKLTLFQPVGDGTQIYLQSMVRYFEAAAAQGSIMQQEQPFALGKGLYQDIALGIDFDKVDRWPAPHDGSVFQANLRLANTWIEGQRSAVGGIYLEGSHWHALADGRVVVGIRGIASKSVGERPFFEQQVAWGRWRDEMGFEQAFSGYGRLRTRGDGMAVGMVEVRTKLMDTQHSFWDVDVHLSVYVEDGWLFEGWTAGPHLPSVGVGPTVIWQGASVIRPFVAVGWLSDEVGGERYARPQFGISVSEPL